jgi:hypothetical protein
LLAIFHQPLSLARTKNCGILVLTITEGTICEIQFRSPVRFIRTRPYLEPVQPDLVAAGQLGGFIPPTGLLVCREGASGSRQLAGLGLGGGRNFGIAWWNNPKHKRVLRVGEDLPRQTRNRDGCVEPVYKGIQFQIAAG